MSGSSSSPETGKTDSQRTLDFRTGTLLVVASMIGVGVFTTSGFLLNDLKSGWAVLAAWLVGGVSALCGALAYAELGAALPENGGEYHFLTRIYHPALGFSAALASLFIGFSAALASVGLVFGSFLSQDFFPGVSGPMAGVGLIAVVSIVHTFRIGFGHRFQNWSTSGKLLLIVGLIGAGIVFAISRMSRGVAFENIGPVTPTDWNALRSEGFALALVTVSFSYAGWNAVGYVAGEIQNPSRTIPRMLLVATLVVTGLYCALNWAFMISVPEATLVKSDESMQRVAGLSGTYLLGERGGKAVSFLIIAGLVATSGALTYTGARVTEALGRRYRALRILAVRNAGGSPVCAIGLQFVIAVCLLLSAQVETLYTYAGFTLILFNMAVVAGVIVLRIREPQLHRPWKMWGYPLTPLLFLILQAWIVCCVIIGKPGRKESSREVAIFGIGTVLLGVVLYYVVRWGGENADQGETRVS